MQVANFSTARKNFKAICDKVCENDEPCIITRKEGKNVVIMSLDKFNEYDIRLQRLQSYLEKMHIEQDNVGK